MQPIRAIIYKLISVTVFVAMASLIKATSAEVPPGEAVFFRSFFAMPVIVVWLGFRGDLRNGLRVKDPIAHVWRGVLGTVGMGLGFAGLGMLPLPEVTAIGFATPILVVVLAVAFLKERISWVRIGAVGLGLVGVLIILSPRLTGGLSGKESFGALVVLAGAFFVAMVQVYLRKLVQTENAAAIVFYFSLSSTLLSFLTLPFGWVLPSGRVIVMLVLAGVLGGIGQLFLTNAYRFADVSVIAPFQYAAMLLALLIGYFVFSEIPSGIMLLGVVLVIAAGVLIVWREHQLGLERGKARSKMTPGG